MLDLKATEINNNNPINSDEKSNLDQIKFYKKKLQESESKIEELVEMVDKLRNVASDLLNKSTSTTTTTSSDASDSKTEDILNSSNNTDDAFYANSYSSYTIHLEMLQVK